MPPLPGSKSRLAELPDTDVREIEVRSGITSADEGTNAFAALRQALADVPPERYAGAIMITDGQVHDVPQGEPLPGYDGPLHALVTGKPGEIDRTVRLAQAPRFGIVGERQALRFIVAGCRRPGRYAGAGNRGR